ncbi:hypothetical protein BS78_01G329400 [Paspalum vaginatum]|nr:hypothetical protein BS78_01G329400 [Paspalum vaginatum]
MMEEGRQQQDMLQAYIEHWHQSLSYVKSLTLAVALDLRIPDAIHHHGGAATAPQILAKAGLHPCKLPALRRLMRVLTAVTGTFTTVQHQQQPDDESDDEAVYKLTAVSRFLVSDDDDAGSSASATTLAPFVTVQLHLINVSPYAKGLCAWFRQEQNHPSTDCLALRHDETVWERPDHFNAMLNKGMESDSRFLMSVALSLEEFRGVFQGIDSLVDVGGGFGGAAAAIAAAFPHLKCSVLDLPHVVAGAPSDTNVQFIAGDMFKSIPPATAVFLKTTLHDWADDECVKILKKCKQAIPPRDAGGKVIIVDMVVGYGAPNRKVLETQVMFDIFIMMVNGAERDEQEWKKIFTKAGFKDYKILPVLGVHSIIEVYP